MAMNDCNDMTHMIWIYCPYHIIHSISSVSCGPYHMANRRQTKKTILDNFNKEKYFIATCMHFRIKIFLRYP